MPSTSSAQFWKALANVYQIKQKLEPFSTPYNFLRIAEFLNFFEYIETTLFFSSLISFRGNWRYYTSQILNIYYYLRIIFHLEWLIDFFQSIINSGKSIIGSNTNRKPTSSIYFVNTNSSNTKEQSMSRTIYDT